MARRRTPPGLTFDSEQPRCIDMLAPTLLRGEHDHTIAYDQASGRIAIVMLGTPHGVEQRFDEAAAVAVGLQRGLLVVAAR